MKRSKIPHRVRVFLAAVFFIAVVVAFAAKTKAAAFIASWQFGPALLTFASGLLASSLPILVVIAILTFVFGRYFCSIACPIGILQDFIGRVSPMKGKPPRNAKLLRYSIMTAAALSLLFGWAVWFRFLEPFSNFGGAVGTIAALATTKAIIVGSGPSWTFIAGGLLPIPVLIGLVLWKRRVYCTSICLVGTILGLVAKHGLYRIRIDESCVKCGKCLKVCPAGCIDIPSRQVDNERCLRCLACLPDCPVGALSHSYEKITTAPAVTAADQSRRRFLAQGTAAVAGLIVAGPMAGSLIPRLFPPCHASEGGLLPPGALNKERFSRLCTSCQMCVAKCPSGIIKPAGGRYGPVHLDFSAGVFRPDCTICGSVCPTGALRPLVLGEKRRLRIGLAHYNEENCMVAQYGEMCGLCSEKCPVGAITMISDSSGLEFPRVDADKCIGCGVCQNACPGVPSALTVKKVASQVFI